MHHANVFYGHAAVLARYCGLPADPPPPIWGYLQHGWNTHDGFAVGHDFVPGVPKLVWTDHVARRGWALGRRDYQVIGSPWAYLLALRADEVAAARADTGRRGTIVYPFHGWEGQQIVGDHTAYADELIARERAQSPDEPITVCLYWNDYDDESVRRAYADRGLRVITHGRRGRNYLDVDHGFIDRQLSEILAHRRVVSNRLGSALLYGASTGAEIGVYGDPMVLENDHAVLGGMARQWRLFPQLHQPVVPAEQAQDVARAELGLDQVMSPAALREQLGWTGLTQQSA